jgi:hypothetical protein
MASCSVCLCCVFERKLCLVNGQVNLLLQKLAWNGIPHNYRSSAWKIMLVSLT